MFLAAAAMVSAWLIAIANIPQTVTGLLQPFMGNKIVLMLVINLIIIVIGTAMDVTPTILILTPVLMPIVKQAGIDPVYFGLIFILNNVIGLLTPPVGASLFVLSSITGEKIERITASMWPFVIAEVAVLFLVAYWPRMTLSVPALLGL